MKPAIALLLVLALPAFAADPTPPGEGAAESRRLSEAAFEKYHRANDLEEGSAEVYDQAIELAEKAIALDPRNADAHYALFLNLGRKSERSGIVAQARNMGRLRQLLETTLELDPRHAHAWEAMGEMRMRLPRLMGGSERKGEEAFRRAADLDAAWAKPRLRLAQCYWSQGRRDEARAEALAARDLARSSGDQRSLEEAETLLAEVGSGP